MTPVSNAGVERIFSLVSSMKTKARNRMQLNLLDTIVRFMAELLFQATVAKTSLHLQKRLKKKKKKTSC
jgi:hypothetical protein